MQIIPDPTTAALLVVPFLLTYAALYFILFRPLQSYMDEREEHTVKARAEAARMQADSDATLHRLEGELASARRAASEIRNEARTRAHAQEAEIVAEARREAESKVAGALEAIAEEKRQAALALRETAGGLSDEIAGRVLGRAI